MKLIYKENFNENEKYKGAKQSAKRRLWWVFLKPLKTLKP
jgi:hypothetical protein